MLLQDVKQWANNEATEGELIHLVNSLYKNHGIFPTKLKVLVLEDETTEDFGDITEDDGQPDDAEDWYNFDPDCGRFATR